MRTYVFIKMCRTIIFASIEEVIWRFVRGAKYVKYATQYCGI